MDPLSQATRRIPGFILHRLNRAPQTRFYTLETINRRRLRAEQGKGKDLRPVSEPQQIYPPKVEAYGKLRDQSSNAAKAERLKESLRVEKALRHECHGENIYAYVHIATGQVVYSLTKVMDNHKSLSQLVFHGKKTVPASLRRDLWTPYFSLHFPSSYSGLLSYHKLRELSLQRQLAPPDYLVMTTKQSASKAMRARMSKEQEEEWEEKREGKEHPRGIARLKSNRERAKALMEQKATSVADVAFVVDLLQREGHLISPAAVEKRVEARRSKLLEVASKRKKRKHVAKMKKLWAEEERRKEVDKERKLQLQEGTKWGLEKYTAKRIALEHGGVVLDPSIGKTKVILPKKEGEGENPDELDAPLDSVLGSSQATAATAASPLEIRIFWSDLRDATYAVRWPEFVSHGELERLAVSRQASSRANGRAVDVDTAPFKDRTVHVIGVGRVVGRAGGMWMRGLTKSPVGGGVGVEQQQGKGEESMDGAGKSREEQAEELEREGVVLESPSRRRGVFGWVKRKLGLGAA